MTRIFNHWRRLIMTATWAVALNSSLSAQDVTGSERASSPEGVRFNVENDSIAEEFKFEQDAKDVFMQTTWREIVYMPEEHKQMKLVPSIDRVESNALLETVRTAYHEHRPLALSPDVIWLTICQGISIHINMNFNSLEKKIYPKGHPKSILVRVDTVAFDASQWSVAVDSLSQQTRRYTNPYFYEAFVPQFSTTTPIDHIAYQITLLHAQKEAFSYNVESGCGIPWIVLRGTTEDWMLIKDKLSILDTLGMKEWKASLIPIINQFIAASKGKAKKSFWMNIYKDKQDYGLYSITGWIHKLFPYIMENIEPMYDDESEHNDDSVITYLPDREIMVKKIKYKSNPFLYKKVTSSDNLTSKVFPSSTVKLPFTWHNVFENKTESFYFWSGIWGTKQYGDKTLEPFISWALTVEKEFERKNLPDMEEE